MEDVCLIYTNPEVEDKRPRANPNRPDQNQVIYDWILDEIQYIKMHCRTNLGGYWELDHSSYSGGLDEMEAEQAEWWFQIINTMNHFIKERQDEKKNK